MTPGKSGQLRLWLARTSASASYSTEEQAENALNILNQFSFKRFHNVMLRFCLQFQLLIVLAKRDFVCLTDDNTEHYDC